jgi:hypothetical protein
VFKRTRKLQLTVGHRSCLLEMLHFAHLIIALCLAPVAAFHGLHRSSAVCAIKTRRILPALHVAPHAKAQAQAAEFEDYAKQHYGVHIAAPVALTVFGALSSLPAGSRKHAHYCTVVSLQFTCSSYILKCKLESCLLVFAR